MDASGARPVFAYGKTGGINYFLDRDNPTSSTHGFALSGFPEKISRQIKEHPDVLLIDVPLYDFPDLTDNRLSQWWTGPAPSVYRLVDRSIFHALIAGCDPVGTVSAGRQIALMSVYDCSSAGRARGIARITEGSLPTP